LRTQQKDSELIVMNRRQLRNPPQLQIALMSTQRELKLSAAQYLLQNEHQT